MKIHTFTYLTCLASLLCSCAIHPAPPADLSAINRLVNENVRYKYYHSSARRPVFRDVFGGEGNCFDIAFTKWMRVVAIGRDAKIQVCRIPNGDGHAYLRTGEWALDNRYPEVLLVVDEDCK